jgi:serine/threonine protein phosphatase PrpC
MLDEGEAIHHRDRHLLSNAVGTPGMRVDVGPTLAIARRDTLLVASDGLFDNLRLDEIVARIRSGPLQRAMAGLVGDCRRRMEKRENGSPSKPDDLTVIAFRPG